MTGDTAYVVNREAAAWRVIDDEAVIIHSETSDYFSLNQSGTWLWSLMEAPCRAADLASALGRRYGRAPSETVADVAAYLDQLAAAGLIRVDGHAGAAPASDGAPPRDAYEPPQLVRFGNLETLILSGE